MKINIRNMVIDDYSSLINLFKSTPGITVREADSEEATKIYLERNPGLSLVAEYEKQIVGCIMCGHDGRRAYLQHLLVIPQYRKMGIGKLLVENCIKKLEEINILKSHLFVLKSNKIGNKFWINRGWKFREEINMYSFVNSKNPNI